MGERYKTNGGDFRELLQSVLKLDELEKMTNDLDKELADSQKVMMEIRSIYDSVYTVAENTEEPDNEEFRQENISKILESDLPKLLIPDMAEEKMDIDVNEAISSLNSYSERIKHSLVLLDQQLSKPTGKTEFDLDQYAQSLDQLGKRLKDMKMNKNDDVNLKNPELEAKLQQLCEDVDMFTKLIESKETLGEKNKNWSESLQNGFEMQYSNMVKNLNSGLNEVIYLLKNIN